MQSNRASPTDRDAAPLERAPRFALGWAMLVYAIAVLSLGYHALGGGFLVNPHSDQFIAGFAFREFAAEYMKACGSFPLWNPYLYGGRLTNADSLPIPGLISLSLDSPAPAGSAVIVSENYYPGWTATVDGRSAPVGRVDHALIGVELSAGARNVVLSLDSTPYHTGAR